MLMANGFILMADGSKAEVAWSQFLCLEVGLLGSDGIGLEGWGRTCDWIKKTSQRETAERVGEGCALGTSLLLIHQVIHLYKIYH